METNKICPYKNTKINKIPENLCVLKGSYCIWPCEYELCDTYKQHTRFIEMLNTIYPKEEVNEES